MFVSKGASIMTKRYAEVQLEIFASTGREREEYTAEERERIRIAIEKTRAIWQKLRAMREAAGLLQ